MASAIYHLALAVVLLTTVSPHAVGQPRLDWVASVHGNGIDSAAAMAVDAKGNIYLTGSTTSSDLGTLGAFQSRRASSNLISFDASTGKLTPVFPPSTSAAILSIASDTGRPGTVYAATDVGLIRTTDNGRSWSTLAGGFPSGRPARFVALAPSDSNIVYAVTSNRLFVDFSLSADGLTVFRSSDAGETWEPAAPIPASQDPFSPTGLVVDPFDARRAYLLVPGYGARSLSTTDAGSSWTTDIFPFSGLTFDPSSPGTVYAAATGSLLKSTDHGASFQPLGLRGLTYIHALWPDPKHPGTVYLSGTGAGPVASGIYRSTDAGGLWTLVNPGSPPYTPIQFLEDPATGSLYFADPQYGIFRSDDGFETSTQVILRNPFSMVIPQPGTVFFALRPPSEMFVSKLDPDGRVMFTTYIGGIIGSQGTAITIGGGGQIYVAAVSQSPDFPTTASLESNNTQSAGYLYLLELSSDGTRLQLSTRIAGAGTATIHGLALDQSGNIYLGGTAYAGYLTTPNSVQPSFGPPRRTFQELIDSKAFATKFAPDGKTLIYSTYLGGLGAVTGWSVIPDSDGNAYIGGTSVWKLNTTGTAVLSVYGVFGEVHAAALDKAGNLYACGGVPDRFTTGYHYAFAAKWSPAGELSYNTRLDPWETQELATAIVVDDLGNATVTGLIQSIRPRFPARYPLQGPFNEKTSFLMKLNADGSDFFYSTYLGDRRPFSAIGLAFQPYGALIVAGGGSGTAFVNRIVDMNSPPLVHVDAVLSGSEGWWVPIAPGESIVVRGGGFGPDSRLFIGDQPIPITSTSSTEIRAQVPETFSPGGATTVRVESAQQTSPPVFVDTAAK